MHAQIPGQETLFPGIMDLIISEVYPDSISIPMKVVYTVSETFKPNGCNVFNLSIQKASLRSLASLVLVKTCSMIVHRMLLMVWLLELKCLLMRLLVLRVMVDLCEVMRRLTVVLVWPTYCVLGHLSHSSRYITFVLSQSSACLILKVSRVW